MRPGAAEEVDEEADSLGELSGGVHQVDWWCREDPFWEDANEAARLLPLRDV